MNRILYTIASLCLIISPMAIACDYPQRADVPNGATASKDEMLAGQQSVKSYMTAMEEYLTCMENDEKAALAEMDELSEEERATRDAAMTKKYNAAVEEMEVIAAQFNEEVRAYKEQGQ